jgi:hypothetical protein
MNIKLYIRILICFSIFLSIADGAASQNSVKLNQAQLLKQFEGTWTCEIGKDTLAQWDMIPWGTGFEARLKYIHKGKIIKEGKGLYGYDSTLDRIVEAGITKGMDIGVYVMWFVSERKWILVPYNDLKDPEKASFKMEGEFRSPGNLVEINYTDNKPVKTKSWSVSGK